MLSVEREMENPSEVEEKTTVPRRRSSLHPLAQDVREARTSSTTDKNEEDKENDILGLPPPSEPLSNGLCLTGRFSERTTFSSTNFTMRSSSLHSSQYSQASSALMSFSGADFPLSSQVCPPDGPVSLDQLKIALSELVEALMPTDIDLYEHILKLMPEFAEKYRDGLRGNLKTNLATIFQKCIFELNNCPETARMEALLREIDIYKRDPKMLAKLLDLSNKSPESRMADPKEQIGHSVGKAMRYSEREMQRLMREDEELKRIIKKKTAQLHGLTLRSEDLVAKAEQVAVLTHSEDPTSLAVPQVTLANLLQHNGGGSVDHAVYAAIPKKSLK